MEPYQIGRGAKLSIEDGIAKTIKNKIIQSVVFTTLNHFVANLMLFNMSTVKLS